MQLEITKTTDQLDQDSSATPEPPKNENEDGCSRTGEGPTGIDKRLMGETAENIFLSLVNQRGVFATSFDTEGLDGIVFDPNHRLFKVGQSPFFVQVKSRNSDTDNYQSKNFPHDGVRRIESFAKNLGITRDSLYFVIGFSKGRDIRTIKYFAVPFSSLDRFKTRNWYVFSVNACEEAMQEDSGIFDL